MKKGIRILGLIGIIGVGCKGPGIGVRVGYLNLPLDVDFYAGGCIFWICT